MNENQLQGALIMWDVALEMLANAYDLDTKEEARYIMEQLMREDKDIRVSKSKGLVYYE